IDDGKAIAKRMAEILDEVIGLTKATPELLKMVTDKDLRRDYTIDSVTLSGGVADCLNSSDSDLFSYGDIGILLGRAISDSLILKSSKLLDSRETIRATVVGAGSHTTDISGSTITVSPNALPVKNIPVLKLTKEDEMLDFESLSDVIRRKLEWFNLEGGNQTPALAMTGPKGLSFEGVKALADAVLKGLKTVLNNPCPIIVIVENDLAKVLGQTLLARINDQKDVICIDTVKVENGDYIDIGRELAGGRIVPVIVKTLLFNY
ncbi:MAG: ethanolamine ammonia-lyase, partial [Desulfobacterales bacterium]|nr:ethanolamine ammonia-lyase [Desulfobacterales bacterium]